MTQAVEVRQALRSACNSRPLYNAITDVLDSSGQADLANTWTQVQTFAQGIIITTGGATITAGDLTLTAGNLKFSAASARVIPGATSLLVRNAANDATNVTIVDAGSVTFHTGNVTLTAGNLLFGAASAKVIPGATSLLIRNNADDATNLGITDAGLATLRAGLVVTTGGIRISGGRLIENITNTDVDAQNNTLTVAQIVGGKVTHTSATGGGTVTTDTAANIIAGSSGVGALTANGDSIKVLYVNDGDQTLTLAGGDSVTVSDTGQTIAANESALLSFIRTSPTAVTCDIIGA